MFVVKEVLAVGDVIERLIHAGGAGVAAGDVVVDGEGFGAEEIPAAGCLKGGEPGAEAETDDGEHGGEGDGKDLCGQFSVVMRGVLSEHGVQAMKEHDDDAGAEDPEADFFVDDP